MKEPFANLDANTIDEHIESVLQTIPSQQDDEESRCLRDLHYLYRKEEILARTHQRLMIASQPEQTHTARHQQTFPDNRRREHAPMFSRPQTLGIRKPFSRSKIFAVLVAALLLIGTIIETTSFFSTRIQKMPEAGHKGGNTVATATALATPSVGTIIFSDPLSTNNHNWPVAASGAQFYHFENGAYHVANNDGGGRAVSPLLPNETFKGAFVYTLTMYEVKGDDTTFDNQFGLVFHYSSSKKGHSTFYFFGVANTRNGGEYLFSKHDGSFGDTPWTTIWHQGLGKEYHMGQGPAHKNTLKVAVNGKKFVFYVNGKKLGSAQDTSFSSGQIGMLVNLKGTEVAFSNLLVTQPDPA